MSIVIEKGVLLPTSIAGRPRVYPFPEMNIGDSFFTPNKIAYASASGFKKKNRGWDYTGRQEGDGVRIWRVA